MKLLMISGDRSVLSGQRGAFWYTLQEMRKHWDRIDILCPKVTAVRRAGNVPAEKKETPSNVFFHPSPRGLLHQPFWIAKRGRQLIAEHHHDVMTVHEYPPFYNGRGALKLHRRTGVPFVLEVHHIVGWPVAADSKERIGRVFSSLVFPFEARFAGGVRAVSAAVMQWLEHAGVPSASVTLVPSFYLDHAIIKKVSAPPKSYDIAICSRLVPNKGVMNVINALQFLPDARLLVVGDGPLRADAERRVVRMGIANRVTFLGWLPTLEAVLDAVLTARTFVMASTSEGGPRSALEAMACGMPIIATRVGIMPEVIEEGVNGLFTDGSSRDIADKVRQLLDDEVQRTAMGQKARAVLDRYERTALIAKYADYLKGIARSV